MHADMYVYMCLYLCIGKTCINLYMYVYMLHRGGLRQFICNIRAVGILPQQQK